jgi:hypothetical protein
MPPPDVPEPTLDLPPRTPPVNLTIKCPVELPGLPGGSATQTEAWGVVLGQWAPQYHVCAKRQQLLLDWLNEE